MAGLHRDGADDAMDAVRTKVHPPHIGLLSRRPSHHLWTDAQDCRRQYDRLPCLPALRYLGIPLLEKEDKRKVSLVEEQCFDPGLSGD